MADTSKYTAYKNRYQSETYDQLRVLVKKSGGGKERVKARADALGMSINAYINMLIDEDMKKAARPPE